MKFVLALAAALSFHLSALAMDSQPLTLNLSQLSTETQNEPHYYYDFGSVLVNSTRFANLTLQNNTPEPLNIMSVQIMGFEFDTFHSCPATLLPGQRCFLRVHFTPRSEGYKTGQIWIFTNQGRLVVHLSGWGRRF